MPHRLSFVHDLPERPESCLRGAIEALRANDPIVSQTVSSLEAPSAVAVVRELFPHATIAFLDIPQPDPRLPLRPVPFQLWRYDGVLAAPVPSVPRGFVLDAVAVLAETPYCLDEWAHAAARSSGELRDATCGEVLAAMVHPPRHATMPLWDWRFRVQVAAVLIASSMLPSAGAGVEALATVMDGPVDWSTTAAIIGMLAIARGDPGQRDDVTRRLLLLIHARTMSPIWWSCGALPAAVACQDIPGHSSTLRQSIEGIVAKLAE